MMILKKYVLFLFLRVYLLTATGLIGIFLIVDFFERVDEFMAKNAPLIDLASYYVYKIPFVANYMAPQAVLLATVITHRHEGLRHQCHRHHVSNHRRIGSYCSHGVSQQRIYFPNHQQENELHFF